MKKAMKFDLKTSPLLLAVEQGDLERVSQSIGELETVDIRDRDGNTPLIRASFLGNIDLVRILLGHGAEANAVNNRGWSGLHFAAQENRENVAKLLFDAGAIVDLRDVDGNTPLSNAVFASAKEMIVFLLAKGASLDTPNDHGVSPRELADSMGLVLGG